jgi:ubiquinone biosynthesis protein COQ9
VTIPGDRDAILRAVLGHVPFDSWSAKAYAAGEQDSGLPPDRAALAFPDGIDGVAAYFGMSVARKLEVALEGLADSEPSIRKRIAIGVRTFVGLIADHREQVRRLSPLARSRGNWAVWAFSIGLPTLFGAPREIGQLTSASTPRGACLRVS